MEEAPHKGPPQPPSHCHKLCVTFLPFPSLFPCTEQKHKEALEKEKERLQNMDEEEYDALTEEEKIAFNREVQQALRERKKRLESRAEQFPRSNFPGDQGHPPGWQRWPQGTRRMTDWEQENILPLLGARCCSLAGPLCSPLPPSLSGTLGLGEVYAM